MSQIGEVYAQGLYTLAAEENLCKTILDEMSVLAQSFSAEPMFLRLLSAPNVPVQERCKILDDSFRGKIQPYLLNFLKLLTEKGYIRRFSDCYKAYRNRYNEDNGILPVRAITAVSMTEDQTQRLTQKLQAVTGKTVALENVIDPAVMGGVRLDYDGKRVDGTVQSRLNAIRELLNKTVI